LTLQTNHADDTTVQPAAESLYGVDDLTSFAATVLAAVGCSPAEAARVAGSLVEADARGLDSHGLLRLPLYVRAVESGGIVPDAAMTWVHEKGAAATLDAAFGFGHTAIEAAMTRAGELAGVHGCAAVGVRRSTHFGMAAPWVEGLAELGTVALVVSNTGPSMAPYGSAEPLLGTNPLCVGIPVEGRPPVVLDMATSAGAYGRVVSAAARGETIPDEWALDESGLPTTDAQAALGGVLRPFGAHKGSGLAIIIELLAAALPGALLSHEITDIWVDPSSRMGTGHLVVALDPPSLAGPGVFESRVTDFVTRISGATPANGHAAVQLPGELERNRSIAAHRDGVPLADSTVRDLQQVAARLGVTSTPGTSDLEPISPKE
jgi:LDH2 family malate/lactate/ureidoglycolate dehydrogenase